MKDVAKILIEAERIIALGNQTSRTLWFHRFRRRFINKLKSLSLENRFTKKWFTVNVKSHELVRTFAGYKTSSLSLQDVFVQIVCNDNGLDSYLEVGSCYPVRINNTYILESEHSWKGLSIEIDNKLVQEFIEKRINPCICQDATKIDYDLLLGEFGFSKEIGYLSIDIDPAFQSLNVLTKIPFGNWKFAAITFEHDSYLSRGKIKFVQRKFLKYYGYKIAIRNVKAFGKDSYEDWWIHPDLVKKESVRKLKFLLKNGMFDS